MNIEDLYTQFVEFKGGREPIMETTAVLCYEVGRMLENAMYAKWCKEAGEWDKAAGYMEWYKTELMDAITQVSLICRSLTINFEDYREQGFERAYARFTGEENK